MVENIFLIKTKNIINNLCTNFITDITVNVGNEMFGCRLKISLSSLEHEV